VSQMFSWVGAGPGGAAGGAGAALLGGAGGGAAGAGAERGAGAAQAATATRTRPDAVSQPATGRAVDLQARFTFSRYKRRTGGNRQKGSARGIHM
jgi:hypothetical protein